MRLVAALLCALLAGGASAQGFDRLGLQPAQSPIGIVVVDMDRLYAESRFGKQVAQSVAARRAAIADENRALEAELEAEATALTAQRAEMDPEEFRAKADAFDEKVRAIRAERDVAEQQIGKLVRDGQSQFVEAVNPVLARLMQERGAMLLLERPVVGLVDSSLEITDVAIAAVDAELPDFAAPDPDQ